LAAGTRSAASPTGLPWLRNLWGGESLREFLGHELNLAPPRRIAAIRAFVALLLVALVSAALGPPPYIALSVSIVLTYASRMLDPKSAARAALRLMLEVAASVMLSVLTLAMWADQPWFMLPWAAAVVALLLFYAQAAGGSAYAAVFYVVAVYYQPARGPEDVYTALDALTIALTGCGAMLLTHVVLWPHSPRKKLRRLLSERFGRIERVMGRLCGPESELGPDEAPSDRPIPGVLSDQLLALAAAEASEPALYVRHRAHLDLIVELDTWFNLATWLMRIRREGLPEPAFDGRDQARLAALANDCRALSRRFDTPGSPPAAGAPLQPAPVDRADRTSVALHQMEDCAERVRAAVLALRVPLSAGIAAAPANADASEPATPRWLTREFWLDNSVPLHFGLKYALGATICLLMIQALDWPGIDTAMMTCLVVAQSSLGADYRKSVLRLIGASGGGLLAVFFVVVLQPALTTIAGFLLAVAPAFALAAWIACAGPRIAYGGVQIGYAFASVVLHGTGPVTDLAMARDRVIGILLGIAVMGIIDYLLWPQRADRLAWQRLESALRNLAGFLERGPRPGAEVRPIAVTDRELAQVLELLDLARLEPGADRPEAEADRTRMELVAGDLHGLARTLQTRTRYRRKLTPERMPEGLTEAQRAFDQALARRLESLTAHFRAAPDNPVPPGPDALRELEAAVDRIIRHSLPAEASELTAAALLGLDRVLWQRANALEAHAALPAGDEQA
jgi:multidrug resistance protein MdtO